MFNLPKWKNRLNNVWFKEDFLLFPKTSLNQKFTVLKKRALISGWCWSNTAYYNLETFSSYVKTRWKDWKINYNCYHYTLHWRSYTIQSCRQVISTMIQRTHFYCKLLNCWCFIFSQTLKIKNWCTKKLWILTFSSPLVCTTK